jgi:hypothetical protein
MQSDSTSRQRACGDGSSTADGSGYGRPRARSGRRATGRVHLRAILALAALAAWAGCGDRDDRVARVSETDPTAAVSVDLSTAEWTVAEYYRALAQGRIEDARNLLAPGPRSDASQDELAATARELGGAEVAALQVLHAEGERLVIRAELVQPDRGAERGFEGGDPRWVELAHDRRGWRISRIEDQPIVAGRFPTVVAWTRVHIMEADLSLDVPQGWPQRDGEWAWAAPGRESVHAGIRWYDDAVDGPSDRERLPSGTLIVRTVPLSLSWGSAMEYSLAPSADAQAREVSAAYQVHVIGRVEGSARLLHLHGTAGSAAEQESVRAVLRRMARSLELLDPSGLTTVPPPAARSPLPD